MGSTYPGPAIFGKFARLILSHLGIECPVFFFSREDQKYGREDFLGIGREKGIYGREN